MPRGDGEKPGIYRAFISNTAAPRHRTRPTKAERRLAARLAKFKRDIAGMTVGRRAMVTQPGSLH